MQFLMGKTRTNTGVSGEMMNMPSSPSVKGQPNAMRRNSQTFFRDKAQTVVVFDWDDTLFPTSYVSDDLGLDLNRPLEQQAKLPPSRVEDVRQKLKVCEDNAAATLSRATDLSHVVVVTLASTGWVDLSCKHFYPEVGKLLNSLQIPIIYAQEKATKMQMHYNKAEFQADEELERYWGLIKGHAIAEEVDSFYSQYEGQSWKNILSIGDSCFERYGLLAATSAYMQDKNLARNSDMSVWNPSQEGCWEKVINGHVKKLRAKCCKLVDQPDAEELAVELELIHKWLEGMVYLDDGFDLDLEVLDTDEQIDRIEAVWTGERPVADLPRLPG